MTACFLQDSIVMLEASTPPMPEIFSGSSVHTLRATPLSAHTPDTQPVAGTSGPIHEKHPANRIDPGLLAPFVVSFPSRCVYRVDILLLSSFSLHRAVPRPW